jgi:hypothetical protein
MALDLAPARAQRGLGFLAHDELRARPALELLHLANRILDFRRQDC